METETFEENLPGSPEDSLEIVAPFLRNDVLTELCSGRHFIDYRERKIQKLREGTARAMQRQRLIASFNAGIEAREVGGFRRTMCIDPLLYMAAREKYGPKCWRDPDFRKHTLKHTPEVRVPEPATRGAVAVNGFRDFQTAGNGAADGVQSCLRGGTGNQTSSPGKPATASLQFYAHEIPAPHFEKVGSPAAAGELQSQ